MNFKSVRLTFHRGGEVDITLIKVPKTNLY